MAIPRGLNIDVIELPAHALTAWFCKVAGERPPGDAGEHGVMWPGRRQMAGRWLALEARQNGRFVGAAAARIYPDASADLVLPDRSANTDPSVVTVLLARLSAQLAGQHIRLVTAYLPVQAIGLHHSMAAAGFQRTHDLLVLASNPDSCTAEDPSGDWLFRTSQPPGDSALQTVFARSLIGSLDFPNLSTSASAEATLARFAEAGEPDARMWYLVEYRGRSAGCLLMAADWGCRWCELLYLGLAPEHRRKGGGRALLKYALWTAVKLDLHIIIAGVDATNDPAIAIYAAAGFDPAARRCVFFRRLTADDAVSLYGHGDCVV
jgi:GNAT superfamily N-acetyltransferase